MLERQQPSRGYEAQHEFGAHSLKMEEAGGLVAHELSYRP